MMWNSSMIQESISPRERRHQRTQQAILTAAREIIHSEGVAGLSMRAIAERIDYSPAGLYEYFGGKDEIIVAVCDEAFEQLAQALRNTDPALPPVEYLRECGVNYVRFAIDNTDAFLLMFTQAPLLSLDHYPPAATLESLLRQSPAFMVLHDAVERCVDAGLFATQPGRGVFEIAIACWQMVHGMAMLAVTIMRQHQPSLDSYRASLNLLALGMIKR
jgi:AcrR family transcriptional regulator